MSVDHSAAAAEPDVTAQLVNALCAEGTTDSEGAFTLDRDKAREKLRLFQLADPRAYVLLLVQAAVRQGASRIAITIDSDDVRFAYDGTPLGLADFEELYGALFAASSSAQVAVRRELALGINAALALNPRFVCVRSQTDTGSVELVAEPGERDRFYESATPVEGTTIHVKARFRPGLLVSFAQRLFGELAEERWLRDRCRYCPVPVELNGAPLGPGLKLENALAEVAIDGQGFHGVAGFVASAGKPVVHLLTNGVCIETQPLRFPEVGFVAVVDGGECLKKDVSLARIVKDETRRRVLAAVNGAFWQSTLALCKIAGKPTDESSRPALGILQQILVEATNPSTVQGAKPGTVGAALALVRFWLTLYGSWVGVSDLLAAKAAGRSVGYVIKDWSDVLRKSDGMILRTHQGVILDRPGREACAFLDRLLGSGFQCLDPWIEQMWTAHCERQRWLQRRAKPVLPKPIDSAKPFMAAVALSGPDLTGEVGLQLRPDGDGGELLLYAITSGCSFGATTEPCSFLHPSFLLVAAVEAPFRPTETYRDVVRDEVFAGVLAALREALLELFTKLAESWLQIRFPSTQYGNEAVLSFVEAALQPDFDERAFVAGETPRGSASVAGMRPLSATGLALLGMLRRAATVANPPALARIALFSDTWGGRYSLVDLGRALRDSGGLSFVPHRSAERPHTDERILALCKSDIELLTTIFGRSALRNVEAKLAEARVAAEFMALPREPVALRPLLDILVRVPWQGANLTGELGFLVPALGNGSTCSVRLLKSERFVVEPVFCLGLPLASAVVAYDGITGAANGRDLEDAGKLALIKSVVRRVGESVLLALAAHRSASPDSSALLGPFLLDALIALFPSPMWREAFLVSYQRHRSSPQDVVNASLELEALRATFDVAEVAQIDAAMRDTLAAGQAPTLDTVVGRLSASPVVPAGPSDLVIDWSDLWRVVGSPKPGSGPAGHPPLLDTLGRLPLFSRHDGARFSLNEILRFTMAGHEVLYVDDPEQARWLDAGDRWVTVLDVRQQEVLSRILPAGRLRQATELIQRARSHRRFMSRKAVSQIALPPESVWVKRPIAAEGLQGEVGLSRASDRTSAYTLFKDKRRLCTIEGLCDHALIAVVNDDRLNADPSFTGVMFDASFGRISATCEALLPSLVDDLVALLPTLDPDDQAAAALHLVAYFAEHRPRSNGQATDPDDARLQLIAQLPLFLAPQGPRLCLRDLAAAHAAFGEVGVLAEQTQGEPEEPARAWITARREMVAELKRIFLRVVEVDGIFAAQQTLREHGIALQRFEPAGQAPVVLAERDVSTPELLGRLWVPWLAPVEPGADLRVAFFAKGYHVAEHSVSAWCPCAGLVDVDVRVIDHVYPNLDSTWSGALALNTMALELYAGLGQQLPQVAAVDAERARAMRAALRAVVLRLERCHSALDGPAAALFRQLKRRSLFDLANGTTRSLDTIKVRRPPELASLGLWDPNNPSAVADAEPATPPLQQKPVSAAKPSAAPSRVPENFPKTALDHLRAAAARPGGSDSTQAQRLRRCLRTLFGQIGALNDAVVREVRWSKLVVVNRDNAPLVVCDGDRIEVNADHPAAAAVAAALPDDPVPLLFLASAVYTAENISLEEVTDDDEHVFQNLLAGLLLHNSAG